MVTIKDVARAAGVSTATVSRALTGTRSVTPAVKEQVRKVAAEMGYLPNRMASNLRRQSSTTLGLLVSDVRNSFFADLARSIEERANQRGYSTILCNSDEDVDKENQYLDVLVAEQIGGLLITPADEQRSCVAEAVAAGIPVVCMDRRIADATLDTVLVDNENAASDAVELMYRRGCRKVALVSGHTEATTERERLAGYRSACRRLGIAADDLAVTTHVKGGDIGSLDDEAHAVVTQLVRDHEPDGLLISNGQLVPGALTGLAAAGKSLGDDIAVVAFDEVPLAAYIGLTCIAQPTARIAARAVDLLLARIDAPDAPVREVVLESTIVERASCALRSAVRELAPIKSAATRTRRGRAAKGE